MQWQRLAYLITALSLLGYGFNLTLPQTLGIGLTITLLIPRNTP